MSDRERTTEPPKRTHRVLVPVPLVLASLALFTGAFAVFAALLALGVAVLRRQTAVEFPGVQRGDAIRELRERRKGVRARKPAIGARAAAPAAAPGPAPPAPSQSIADLERLVALHDSGQLSDTEFATAKTQVMTGS